MPAPARGRPRSEPRADQRRRIVDAARAAFTADGYDAATLSAIARRAGVPRATVYDVVGGKEELLGAVAEEVADEFVAAVDEQFSRDDRHDVPLDELVRDNVRWFVELIAAEPGFAAIIQMSGRVGHDDDDAALRARQRIEDRLTRLHVERARSYGVERDAAARVLAVAVLALLEGVVTRAFDDGWPTDAVAELVAEFATGGYLRTELGGTADRYERDADPDVTA